VIRNDLTHNFQSIGCTLNEFLAWRDSVASKLCPFCLVNFATRRETDSHVKKCTKRPLARDQQTAKDLEDEHDSIGFIDADFSEASTAAAILSAARRPEQRNKGGRSKQKTACVRCGTICSSAREAWNHKCADK